MCHGVACWMTARNLVFSKLWGGTESFWAGLLEDLSFTFGILTWQQAKNGPEWQFATGGIKTCWEVTAWTCPRGNEGTESKREGRDHRIMATCTGLETDWMWMGNDEDSLPNLRGLHDRDMMAKESWDLDSETSWSFLSLSMWNMSSGRLEDRKSVV